MKIAIVYNRESKAVINLFGLPNKEKYGMHTINKVKDALINAGHHVRLFEGDKNIVANLEKFMPRVLRGERPGLVFNLSYGIQGKGRYMQLPGMLEMLGIPYVGSGPETHAIALDKVVTKMILLQRGIPTPRFAVLETPNEPLRESLRYPLIVKPKNEAVSFGLRIVHNEAELKAGVKAIYEAFKSATLVEEYIDGREVNVALLGNETVEALEPLELVFERGEKIFTFEDKTDKTIERVKQVCPAPLSKDLKAKVQDLAIKTFRALECHDSARVDFRIDPEGNPYVLEVNSMASLGENASFVKAAEAQGMTYDDLVQRLVEVATRRIFGDAPEALNQSASSEALHIFSTITESRDKVERELKMLCALNTPTDDPVRKQAFMRKVSARLKALSMRRDTRFSDGKSRWLFTTEAGIENGILFVVPIDTIPHGTPSPFRKEPERLFGEGIAASRGGLVSLFTALDAVHQSQQLAHQKIGIFMYADEGNGMRYSAKTLNRLAKQAQAVFVMAPSHQENRLVLQRRGSMKIHVVAEGKPERLGAKQPRENMLDVMVKKLTEVRALASSHATFDIGIQSLNTTRHHALLPHRLEASVVLTFIDMALARKIETDVRKHFNLKAHGIKTYTETVEVRPPLLKTAAQTALIKTFETIGASWSIPVKTESTILPSAAGEIPKTVPVICGLAPSSKALYTPNESISRVELIQKTMLIAQFLLARAQGDSR